MKSTIDSRQKRIAELKAKGLKNPEIGARVYPNANPTSQRQLVSRQLKKPHVAQYFEQSKLIALKTHNITWDRVVKPISDGLDWEDKHGNPDIQVRLRASKDARELLDLPTKTEDEELKDVLGKLPSNLSELELQRLVFKVNKT